ncbi:alpha-D-glucose phosphate-specific phosphoglucomutase [Sulfitobacter alexandrii]|uniref:phosphoglucomutase (alpha-D-glucose-1,6-bisphosphate-dependent) n=1 Tax=Sulfitobacter alexandrii TaxID=1917485 RepID=A0A1J0WJL5_9RHOB|nr:alpha-D-glucose phosphate-specific phosphoglucomutase [Sulfitobacter alexandrii]APE44491.1 alpha-D-glucose phosphate-specific phosphoglucomutase [Sulfitobacter alexandrii]
MTIVTHACTPFEGQKPGTSGLRKKTRVFMEPGYVECFVQAIFNAIDGAEGKTFVVGGDGRYFNAETIQTILRMASANGAKRAIVGQNGLLSTPAASHLIRKRGAQGGLILSASHNPGGIDADFGLKYNVSNGGPAPESVTSAIFEQTTQIESFRTLDTEDIDLSDLGESKLGEMKVEIVDPVADYAKLMEKIFDFDAIKALFQAGFTMRFDAMHAVTGPYAKAILEDKLGAPEGTVLNGRPSVDFGKGHPDPNPIWAKALVDMVMEDEGPDFAAASDGDGDRNMILGRGIYVTPSDSLAVLAANAHLAPGYADGIAGVARSMPTSRACDRVADAMGIACFETPTGWKFFGNLLDAGKVTLCGEESAGTGSDHVREKDGLWAVLLWLNIIAVKGQSVLHILRDHWKEYGRNYYSRHDFEAVDAAGAADLMSALEAALPDLPGQSVAGLRIEEADQFSYHDPVDGSVSRNQGLRITFEGGARGVLRLSGTGTEGATLRVYLERYEPPEGDLEIETQAALAQVAAAVATLCDLEKHTGRTKPDVMT